MAGLFCKGLYLSTLKKFPSLAGFQFVSTSLQPKSSLLQQIFSLFQHAHSKIFFIGRYILISCLHVYMSTTKKFPSPADFQFVASLHVCSQKVPLSDKFSFQIVEKVLTMHKYKYIFGIFSFFSTLICLNLGILMHFK